ncbi:MAG TPA: DUF4349 domain-containing protein, partial [Anaerolineales bacterium]|nr:DUF4349 domain-containing protein [Anaerolineales bacterium]
GYGGAQPEFYAQAPAAEAPAPAFDSIGAPLVGGGGDGSVVSNALDETKSSVASDGTRLVIKNADLAIVVKDPKKSMAAISKLADTLGGFVVSSNLYQSYYGPNNTEVPEATVTIRVPVAKLDEALADIKKDAVDVNTENVSGQDVTSEYVDLQSRLSAKQAAEKKLTQILNAADKTEDVLAVYTQLQLIETDIEVLKGQIKYYEESAALSAISVRLIAEAGTQPLTVGPWTPTGTAKEAVQDLIYFFQNFVEFLIRFVLYILPALILMAIPLYLVYIGGRALFRRFRKPKAVAEEQAKEEAVKK